MNTYNRRTFVLICDIRIRSGTSPLLSDDAMHRIFLVVFFFPFSLFIYSFFFFKYFLIYLFTIFFSFFLSFEARKNSRTMFIFQSIVYDPLEHGSLKKIDIIDSYFNRILFIQRTNRVHVINNNIDITLPIGEFLLNAINR